MQMPLEKKWLSSQPLSVFRSETDDDVIIFNSLSGETHQINLLALDAIEFLQNPGTSSATASYLADLYQIEQTESFTLQIESLIEQFDDLGLISVCSE